MLFSEFLQERGPRGPSEAPGGGKCHGRRSWRAGRKLSNWTRRMRRRHGSWHLALVAPPAHPSRGSAIIVLSLFFAKQRQLSERTMAWRHSPITTPLWQGLGRELTHSSRGLLIPPTRSDEALSLHSNQKDRCSVQRHKATVRGSPRRVVRLAVPNNEACPCRRMRLYSLHRVVEGRATQRGVRSLAMTLAGS